MTSHFTDARPLRPRGAIAVLAGIATAVFALLPQIPPGAAAPAADRTPARAATTTAATYGIWPDSIAPKERSSRKSKRVTLGLVFSSDTAGRLRGVQYYAANANRRATTGAVWNAKGRRIASVTFPKASSAGWQTAKLDSSVRIRADKRYTVSYRAPHGRFAKKPGVFADGRKPSSKSLTAHRGTFTYGNGRPAKSSRDSNYFVDVLFKASPEKEPAPTDTSTTTSVPTTDMQGWQLTPSNVGLAPQGLSCESLPVYSGPAQIPAGTTISGRKFTIPIFVSAGNITIEKSCFKPTSATPNGLVEGYYPQGDVTIKDSEFDGSLVPANVRETACGFTGGANLIRNYMHDVGSGICMVSTTNTRDTGELPKHILIENNYVHRLFHYSDAHHEAATIRDFVPNAANDRTMTWVGNYLESDSLYVSGGMFIQPTFEPIHNVWLTGNVFAGEGFNLWSTDSGCCVTRNVHVTNNRFKPGAREYYGPVHDEGPGFVEWADNYMYDAGKADARGAVVTP